MTSRIVDVGDINGPTAQLCWAQKLAPPQIMARCDRRKGHTGLHSWELTELFTKIKVLLKETK